jgi:hypothetical protein
MSKEPEFGGLVLERARKKAGIDRLDLFLAYEELCGEFDIEPRSQYTFTKWNQATSLWASLNVLRMNVSQSANALGRFEPAPHGLGNRCSIP